MIRSTTVAILCGVFSIGFYLGGNKDCWPPTKQCSAVVHPTDSSFIRLRCTNYNVSEELPWLKWRDIIYAAPWEFRVVGPHRPHATDQPIGNGSIHLLDRAHNPVYCIIFDELASAVVGPDFYGQVDVATSWTFEAFCPNVDLL